MVDKIQNVKIPKAQDLQAIRNVRKITDHTKSSTNEKKNDINSVPSQKAFKELTKKLEDLRKIVKTRFKYEILKNPDMIVLKMVNEENGEVIRQIPPEEAVRLAKAIDDLLGLFVDKHA